MSRLLNLFNASYPPCVCLHIHSRAEYRFFSKNKCITSGIALALVVRLLYVSIFI